MLEIVLSNRFRKDLKLAKKRHYDLEQLNEIVTKLANRETLLPKNRDHSLSGETVQKLIPAICTPLVSRLGRR